MTTKTKSDSEIHGVNGNKTHPEAIHPEADRFDPQRLKVGQNFADLAGVRKLLLRIPVGKPNRQSFFRVHPDPAYRADVLMLEIKEDREYFLVDPALGAELPGEVALVSVFTVVSRQGVLSLWPVRLPDLQGKRNTWHESARQAAELAMRKWIRMGANMALGSYEVYEASGNFPEPEWPEQNLAALLRIAFSERFIESVDHPVVERLRGVR